MGSRLNPQSNIYLPMGNPNMPRGYFMPNMVNPNMQQHHMYNIYHQSFQQQQQQQHQQQQHISSQQILNPSLSVPPSSTLASNATTNSSSNATASSSSSSSTSSSSTSTTTSSANVSKTNTPYTLFDKNLELATRYFTECTTKDYAGHKKKVNSVHWSLDGKKLASGGVDNTVRVWGIDTTKGKELEIKGHTDTVEQLAWSPINSDILATASSDKTIKIWDTRSGKCTTTINTGGENINLAWYIDGQYMASGTRDDQVSLIDLQIPKIVKNYKYNEEINEISWDKKGELFFMTTGSGTIEIYKYQSKTPDLKSIKTLYAHPTNIYCMDFDPSGKYFAVGSADSLISLWDYEEMFCIRTFGKIGFPARTISFSFDSQFIAYSSEESFVEIAHVESGQSIFQINCDLGLNCVSWHPTQPLLAMAFDEKETTKDSGTIRVFGFHS
ncbi:hypothetical protein CYY_009889 [Polysphondylium violaceum]|uniref:WD40 repeat-containing protein n=1 Tax=Polysphondylium violaceum TaxID=133409 RepID=A0A8J4PJQ2_9MYCE|nr:hypothetical protein CYY_009889 [Polysphondylium violaceum]